MPGEGGEGSPPKILEGGCLGSQALPWEGGWGCPGPSSGPHRPVGLIERACSITVHSCRQGSLSTPALGA